MDNVFIRKINKEYANTSLVDGDFSESIHRDGAHKYNWHTVAASSQSNL